ncbi:hypothetical protein L209DRAFT_120658 [Thermothelomyces heterothallicus CBS 203.75]
MSACMWRNRVVLLATNDISKPIWRQKEGKKKKRKSQEQKQYAKGSTATICLLAEPCVSTSWSFHTCLIVSVLWWDRWFATLPHKLQTTCYVLPTGTCALGVGSRETTTGDELAGLWPGNLTSSCDKLATKNHFFVTYELRRGQSGPLWREQLEKDGDQRARRPSRRPSPSCPTGHDGSQLKV